MKTGLLRRNEGVAAAGVETSGTVSRRIGARLLHEVREALPPTIFFFAGFNFIVFATNLLLADYALTVGSFMLATLAALVVGKAVLVANAMPHVRRYDRAPLLSRQNPTRSASDAIDRPARNGTASKRQDVCLRLRGWK